MRGFIVDTEDDDRVVFVGELRDKQRLSRPRYLRVPITCTELDPPETHGREHLRFVDGEFVVERVERPQAEELSLSSPTLVRDLVAILARQGLVRIKEE